jgi:hypothetical protein
MNGNSIERDFISGDIRVNRGCKSATLRRHAMLRKSNQFPESGDLRAELLKRKSNAVR